MDAKGDLHNNKIIGIDYEDQISTKLYNNKAFPLRTFHL